MSVAFEPAKWYEVAARDANKDCRNVGEIFTLNPVWSNDGIHVGVQCGVCGQPMEILTAGLLEPQPEFS